MIKLLHFADVHIGMENYGRTDPHTGLSTRVMDFLRRMDDMIEFARANEADLAIFAGDAFKTRNPSPTFQREFAWRIQDLADLCPVVLVVGNHDLPINIRKASTIEIYEILRVPNVIVGRENKLHRISTRSGDVQVAIVPYPVRARLLEDDMELGVRGSLRQLDAALQERLELIIRDLGREAAAADIPRVLTGHFTVNTALFGSERQVMVGRDIAVTLANIADPLWDYVALGHVHKFQNLTQGRDDVPPVIYSGSIERVDFSEEYEDKGFVWVELARNATRWQFVPLKARTFVTIRCDVRRAGNPTQVVLEEINRHEVQDAVVKVHITSDAETDARLNTKVIDQRLRDRGASVVAAIVRDVQSPDRTRLGTNPEGLEPPELLARYLQVKEIDPDRINLLLEAADDIFNSVEG